MFRLPDGRFAVVALSFLLLAASLPPSSLSAPTTASLSVPILMYHYVRVNPDPADAVGANLSISPWRFGQQLELLAREGFTSISLDDLRAALLYERRLPPRPIILTFDDGYEDLYTEAYPLLRHFGFRATSFVITGKVGRPGFLTWEQMREMQSSGLVQFESHTVDHLELAGLPELTTLYQLIESKQTMEQELGTTVRYLCYPVGRYDERARRLLTQAGYLAAVSTRYGTAHTAEDLPALARVRIYGEMTMPGFADALGIKLKTVPAVPFTPAVEPTPKVGEPGR